LHKPTRLFLIRHAETDWNAARIFQGQMDSTLTARGLVQAEDLARRLAAEGISAVYSSDQGRAMRTAEVVARELRLTVMPAPELREIDCGDWTGRSYDEVRAGWPEQFGDWKERPHLHCMPGGESVAQVLQRGLSFVEEAWRRHPGESVCAITHHTIVRAVLCHLEGCPLSELWRGSRQPNCAVNLLEMRDGEVQIIAVADTSHLSDVAPHGGSSIA
jgi:broad specificity phosphatase PhoE